MPVSLLSVNLALDHANIAKIQLLLALTVYLELSYKELNVKMNVQLIWLEITMEMF